MKYKDNNKQKTRHRLIVVYSCLFVLFMVTLTLSILALNGRKINIKNAQFDNFGVLIAKIYPSGSAIKVANQEAGFFSNLRFEVSEGAHDVAAWREGYHSINRKIKVNYNIVKRVYLHLFPKQIKTQVIKTYPQLLNSYTSPNTDGPKQHLILNHLAKNQFELVDLATAKPKVFDLNLYDYYSNAKDYNFSFDKWNLNGDSLIFRDVNSIDQKTIIVNYKDPSLTIDLNERYKQREIAFNNIEVSGKSGEILYILDKHNLYRLDISAADTLPQLVLENVQSYSLVDKDKVVAITKSETDLTHQQEITIYNHKNLVPVVFDKILTDTPLSITALRYLKHDYLACLVDKQLRIFKFKNGFYDLKPSLESRDISRSQANLLMSQFLKNNNDVEEIHKEDFIAPPKITEIKNKRFITVNFLEEAEASKSASDQNQQQKTIDNKLFVYDLEHSEGHHFIHSNDSIEGESLPIDWLFGVILWDKTQGFVSTKYFDGQAKIDLPTIKPIYDLQTDQNHNLYGIQFNDNNELELLRYFIATVKSD